MELRDRLKGLGYFRPTPIVKEAWEVTLASAKALSARTILFQCPASFKQNKENIANLEKFFVMIRKDKRVEQRFNFYWEPRGDWDDAVVREICESLNLSQALDPFVTKNFTPDSLYFRLHGRGGWRYEYEDGELRELAEMLPKRLAKGNPPYVFFNNVRMTQDALRFRAIVSSKRAEGAE